MRPAHNRTPFLGAGASPYKQLAGSPRFCTASAWSLSRRRTRRSAKRVRCRSTTRSGCPIEAVRTCPALQSVRLRSALPESSTSPAFLPIAFTPFLRRLPF